MSPVKTEETKGVVESGQGASPDVFVTVVPLAQSAANFRVSPGVLI